MNICKKKEKKLKNCILWSSDFQYFSRAARSKLTGVYSTNWSSSDRTQHHLFANPNVCTKMSIFCPLTLPALPNIFEVICQYSSESWQCEILRIDASHSTIFFCLFFMIKLRTVCKNEIGSLFFCQGKGDIIHENAI